MNDRHHVRVDRFADVWLTLERLTKDHPNARVTVEWVAPDVGSDEYDDLLELTREVHGQLASLPEQRACRTHPPDRTGRATSTAAGRACTAADGTPADLHRRQPIASHSARQSVVAAALHLIDDALPHVVRQPHGPDNETLALALRLMVRGLHGVAYELGNIDTHGLRDLFGVDSAPCDHAARPAGQNPRAGD